MSTLIYCWLNRGREREEVKQFNFRIGNIEARTAYHRDTLEIVQWAESTCWVIVSFTQSRDTARWSAILDEDRPFDDQVDWKHLGEIIKACYEWLNEGSIQLEE